jgi:hypothetical protein
LKEAFVKIVFPLGREQGAGPSSSSGLCGAVSCGQDVGRYFGVA